MDLLTLWTEFFLRPMLHGLLLLYAGLGQNFGIAIMAFTVVVRLLMLPLTLKQLHAAKAMTGIQPRMRALQERYKDDKQRISQETMKLYKDAGVNPAGCLLPTLVQFPIWIGLYQAILQAMPVNVAGGGGLFPIPGAGGGALVPEGMLSLAGNLYPALAHLAEFFPLNRHFLWLDLARPDPSPFVLPFLVGATMWVQQKMSMMPGGDPRTESTNRIMATTMPVMFGFFTISFASGLAIYWVVSNVISIVMQYFVTGWGSLLGGPKPAPAPALAPGNTPAASEPPGGRGRGQETPPGRGRQRGTSHGRSRSRR
ncbi:MAG: membrane protein insertase YidC [Chloroflexi bacterium]|nr:membrane protein insertase YidC [Chloroflexota bacterium]